MKKLWLRRTKWGDFGIYSREPHPGRNGWPKPDWHIGPELARFLLKKADLPRQGQLVELEVYVTAYWEEA